MISHWDRIARVPLAPVLLLQALWVGATAKRFPEASGPREGQTGAGQALRVLILGDSSAAGVGVSTQDLALSGHLVAQLAGRYGVTWQLIAKNGATTAQTVEYMRGFSPREFDVVVIALGVNDVKNGVRMQAWQQDYTNLLKLLEDKFSARLICVSGLPPIRRFPILPQPLRWVMGRRAERFDTELRALTAMNGNVVHVPMDFPLDTSDMADDGIHPGPPIYKAWAGAVFDVIRVRWPAE